MRQSTYKAFASYSHYDGPLVYALLSFLAAVDVPVFLDRKDIRPGTKWRAEIATAIEACEIVFVFWCAHSASSPHVKAEWLEAYWMSKRIVPVLLDNTPLDEGLSEYQWIDMRDAFGPAHTEHNKQAAQLFPPPEEYVAPFRAGVPEPPQRLQSLTLPEVLDLFNRRVENVLEASARRGDT